MPTLSDPPTPALDPGPPMCAADIEGDVAAEESKPLHTSLVALRCDGDVGCADSPALPFGATELANTERPPTVVTP